MANANPNVDVQVNPPPGGNGPPVQVVPAQGVIPGTAPISPTTAKRIPSMNEVSEGLFQALSEMAPRLREFLNEHGGQDVAPTLDSIEQVAEQGKERVRQAQQVAR